MYTNKNQWDITYIVHCGVTQWHHNIKTNIYIISMIKSEVFTVV